MNIKRILRSVYAVTLAMIIALSCGIAATAEKAVPSSADKWGTTALGPNLPTVSVDGYFGIQGVTSTEKNEKEFVITADVNGKKFPLTVTFPAVGGFRMFNENKGYFNPQEDLKIKYTTTPSGKLELTAQNGDGTKLIYNSAENGFVIEVYNSSQKRLFRLTSDQVIFGYSESGELKKVQLEMPLNENEAIYGTGERFNEFNQVGRRLLMWNVDCGYHGNPNSPELWRGYKNVPILYSNRGYTLFYNSYYAARIDVGYTDPQKYTMNFSGPELDFYLFTGNSAQNLMSYTSLTGKSDLLPKWAYRYITGGGSNVWSSEGGIYAKAIEVMENYKSLGTPDIAAAYVEGINESNANVYNAFKRYGVKVLRWNGPGDDISAENVSLALPDLSDDELPYVRINSDRTQKSGNYIDFSSVYAVPLIKQVLKKQIQFGCVGGLLDFGELIGHGTYFAGTDKTGLSMHNMFPYWYAKTYCEAFKENGVDEYVFFSRSACAGSQKFSALFSGDQSSSYEGLREQIVAALSIGACGFSMWGGDLGGYGGMPSQNLYARWTGFSAFSTVFRAHGAGTRFPWDYGELGESTYKTYYWVRENLLNKIYSSAVESSETGLPMMRALAIAYPNNPDYADDYSSYIFCDDLLVAPTFKSTAYYDSITVPSGRWYSLWDGSMITGGGETTVECPVDRISVYIRAGSVIPVTVAKSLKLADSMDAENSVSALMVTAPDFNRTITYRPDENTVVGYKNTAVNNSTFRITAGNGNTATAILAKGIVAAGVSVDGTVLNRLYTPPTDNSKTGYYVESDSSTVIYLGSSKWKSVDIALGKAEIKNLMLSASANNEGAKLAIDGDIETSYQFSSREGAETVFEFPIASSLATVSLKWTMDNAKSYTLETSLNGTDWEEVASPENSYGGIETYDLNGKKVKYIRVSNVVKAGNSPARIYEIVAKENILNVTEYVPDTQNVNNNTTDIDYSNNEDEFYEPDIDDQIIFKPGTKAKYRRISTQEIYFPTWAIVLICVGAVAAIGGTIFIIIYKKNKKKKQAPLAY